MNPDGDDDFMAKLPMDESSLMLVDEFLKFVKSEPNLAVDSSTKQYTNNSINMNLCNAFGNDISIKAENFDLNMQSMQVDGTINGTCDTIIDPNDFFNDMYKSEVDYSSTFSSPSYRNTPSPTTSNSSQSSASEQLTYDYSSSHSNHSEASLNLQNAQMVPAQQQQYYQMPVTMTPNYHLDTPPISPPVVSNASNATAISYIPTTISSQSIPVINHVLPATDPNTAAANNINIIQGTLIPITTVSLSPPKNGTTTTHTSQVKKIKIQPKPLPIATMPITTPTSQVLMPKSAPTPKRIVLSGSDYKALMQKCKAQTNDKQSAFATNNLNPKVLKVIPAAVHKNLSIMSSNSQSTVDIKPPQMQANNVQNNRIQITPTNPQVTNKKPKTKLHNEIDDRLMKKQMRMIKNRESACLSRKKKKEYVTTLEYRLSNLENENQHLKSENNALKDRLSQAANKICDFCGNLMTDKSSKDTNSMTSLRNVSKKTTAYLLALVFMVSINVGPYISTRSTDLTSYGDEMNSLTVPKHQFGTRGLLWVEDDEDSTNSSTKNNENGYPMCPVPVNQTESIRLASELQRWIGDLPEYFNLTKTKSKQDLDLTEINNFLLSSFYKQMKGAQAQKRVSDTPKRLDDAKLNYKPHKSTKQNHFQVDNKPKPVVANDIEINKKLEVYSPVLNHAVKYAEFFKQIHRQDDTFYVVSFSGDHLLLPALAHNKTFRPKMALMLPAFGNMHNNNNGSIEGIFTLMQIDCEVVNTSMIHIKEASIPDELRNRSATAAPSKSHDTKDPIINVVVKPRNARINRRRNTGQQLSLSQSNENDFQLNRKEYSANNVTNDNAAGNIGTAKRSTTKFSNDSYESQPPTGTAKTYKPYFLRKKPEKLSDQRSNDLTDDSNRNL